MSVFHESLDRIVSDFNATLNNQIQTQHDKLEGIERHVRQLRRQAKSAAKIKTKLASVESKLQTETRRLKDRMDEQTEKIVRVKRELRDDRVRFANLWPPDNPLPTILGPYRHDSEEAREEELRVLEREKIKQEMALDVRRALKLRANWTCVESHEEEDLGFGETSTTTTTYYSNSETGESSWTEPLEMQYVPPVGWNLTRGDWEAGFDPAKEISSVEAVLKVGQTDYDAEDPSLEKNPHGQEEEEEEEEDAETKLKHPVELRREIEACLEHKRKLQDELEIRRDEHRALAYQLLLASNLETEQYEIKLDQERAQEVLAEQQVRDALQHSVEVARSEALGLIKQAAEQDQLQDATVLERVQQAKRKLAIVQQKRDARLSVTSSATRKNVSLLNPLSEEHEVRWEHPDYHEASYYALMRKTSNALEESENQLWERHGTLKETLEGEVEKVQQHVDTLEQDMAGNQKLQRRYEQVVANNHTPLTEPVLSIFPDLSEFDPIQAIQERQQERQAKKVKAVNAKAESKGREEEVGAEEEEDRVEELDDDELSDFELGEENSEDEDSENSEDSEDEDANLEDRDMDAFRAELELDEAKKAAFVARQVEKEQKRRENLMSVFEHTHRYWEQQESKRQQRVASSEHELSRLVTEHGLLDRHRIFQQRHLDFLISLLEAESRVGNQLWTDQQVGSQWRSTQVIVTTTRQERLCGLQRALKEFQIQREETLRLPLQAMNPLELMRLEKQMKAELEKLDETLAALVKEIDREDERHVRLKQLDERMLKTQHERYLDAVQNQDEKLDLWEHYREFMEENHRLFHQHEQQQAQERGLTGDLATSSRHPYEYQDAHICHMREMLTLMYQRERRWNAITQNLLESSEGKLSKSLENHDDADDVAKQDDVATSFQLEAGDVQDLAQWQAFQDQHRAHLEKYQTQLRHVEEEKQEALEMISSLREHYQLAQTIEGQTSETIERTHVSTIEHLRRLVSRQTSELSDLKHEMESEMKALLTQHEQYHQSLQLKYHRAKEALETQTYWIGSLKSELSREKGVSRHLVQSYAALEKRRSEEMTEYRRQLSGSLSKGHSVQMWNDALRIQMVELQELLVGKERAFGAQRAQHVAEQRKLRYEIWKHRTCAQRILTTPEHLVHFFAQGLANLAGTTSEHNSKLADLAVLELAAALASSQAHQRVLQRHAAVILGKACWNRAVPRRLIGWQAKQMWYFWLDKVALVDDIQTFDHVPDDEQDSTMNLLAEKHEVSTASRPNIIIRGQWALRAHDRPSDEFECPHEPNQRWIGQHAGILATLLRFCTQEDDAEMQRHATTCLAVASIHRDNQVIMGQVPTLISTLVKLLNNDDSTNSQVQANAVTTLANLAYQNVANQDSIASARGLDTFVRLLTSASSALVQTSLAALANCVSQHPRNAAKVGSLAGMSTLVELCHDERGANVVDRSVLEDIQSNASECLVNIIQARDDFATSDGIVSRGVEPFVLMCGSDNKTVQFHAALMLGNLSQDDACREALGDVGAVRALFHLTTFPASVASATWALGNLSLNRANQFRIGLQLDQLMRLCLPDENPVVLSGTDEKDEKDKTATPVTEIQENALNVLANALFHSPDNRQRVLPYLKPLVALLLSPDPSPTSICHILRSLVAASYSESIAHTLGELHVLEWGLQSLPGDPRSNEDIQQQLVFLIQNVCTLDRWKPTLLALGGIEQLVEWSAVPQSPELRASAEHTLKLVSNLTELDELAERREIIGLGGMIQIAQTCCASSKPDTDTDSSKAELMGMATESIAHGIWREPSTSQRLVQKECGIEVLVDICATQRAPEAVQPALWALRNVTCDNRTSQDRAAACRGVQVVVSCCARYAAQENAEMLETALSTLMNLVMDHERNSRQVMLEGLDLLIQVAQERPREERGDTNADLAQTILRIIGPYNWIQCRKCHHKEKQGTRCSQCGYQLLASNAAVAGQKVKRSNRKSKPSQIKTTTKRGSHQSHE